MAVQHRISRILLDESAIIRRAPEIEHERAVAIADLQADNYFAPVGAEDGPYEVELSIRDNRLDIAYKAEGDGKEAAHIKVPISAFRRVIKDYFMICESYYAALNSSTPGRIEAIDMGRRGVHNEGAEILKDILEDKVEMNQDTARRLFTLICVLHIK